MVEGITVNQFTSRIWFIMTRPLICKYEYVDIDSILRNSPYGVSNCSHTPQKGKKGTTKADDGPDLGEHHSFIFFPSKKNQGTTL